MSTDDQAMEPVEVPATAADEDQVPNEKHPRIALLRAATRVEVALLMQRYSERFDVFGPFLPCPVDPSSVLSVTPEGKLTRAYRCYELTQIQVVGEGELQRPVVSGFCFAKSYGDFKRYAEHELKVTLIQNPEAADG